jgi:hypothetical protein
MANSGLRPNQNYSSAHWRVLHGVRSQTDYPDTKSFQKRFFAQSIFKVDVRIFGVEQKGPVLSIRPFRAAYA